MGMAPAAHVLFSRYVPPDWRGTSAHIAPRFFNTNPKNSKWYNRDRFVLSNGCVHFPHYAMH